jgi:hypothetical protein
MRYKIEQIQIPQESFGAYKYKIYKNEILIANYWHDYRGDEHEIEFINGEKEGWPVGRMVDFIQGGGPQPLTLSTKAEAYLDQRTK